MFSRVSFRYFSRSVPRFSSVLQQVNMSNDHVMFLDKDEQQTEYSILAFHS